MVVHINKASKICNQTQETELAMKRMRDTAGHILDFVGKDYFISKQILDL